jgi:hypothetical protein
MLSPVPSEGLREFVVYIPAMVDQPGPIWALGFDHRHAIQESAFSTNMTKASAKHARSASEDVLRRSKGV